MSVKVGKLWSDAKFQRLGRLEKLLYIYLASNPDINTVGVICPNLDVVKIELDCNTEELRGATRCLISSNYLKVKEYDKILYFIVPAHFNTIPKSESSVAKVQKQLKQLPKALVDYLDTLGIKTSSKVRSFSKPEAQEVTDYALSLGYNISGEDFIKYYEDQSERYGKRGVWVDGKGTQVRDWKAKLRRVWCRDENKLKEVKGAPKGFESFHVIFEGKTAFPDSWKNNKPHSKNLALDMKLKREYEERKGSS